MYWYPEGVHDFVMSENRFVLCLYSFEIFNSGFALGTFL